MKFFDVIKNIFGREPVAQKKIDETLKQYRAACEPIVVPPGLTLVREIPITKAYSRRAVFLFGGKEHTFGLRCKGTVHDHSEECALAYDMGLPCGCMSGFRRSPGPTRRCEERAKLDGQAEQFWRSRPVPSDPDEYEEQCAQRKLLEELPHRHHCTCGHYDRPKEPNPQFSPSGLRTDEPLAVLYSHPDFPNTLSEKYEGRWIGTNPAWPELSVESFLDRWLGKDFHVLWADSSADNYEVRDGLKGVIVYVRPGPKLELSKELVNSVS